MLEVRDDQGEWVRFCTAEEVPRYIGKDVTPEMVYKWRKRRKVNGYKVDGVWHFRVDELKEVEGIIRRSGKGRPRESGTA